MPEGSTVIPAFHYRDAGEALEWLQRAFGFQARVVHRGEGDAVEHAELVHGRGMIMIGTARDNEWGRHVRPPGDGGPSHGAYVVLQEDVDAHAARAREAGAELLYGPRDTSFGTREYAARDPFGHVWSFGTYDPWAPPGGAVA